jgi:hypothetical protein
MIYVHNMGFMHKTIDIRCRDDKYQNVGQMEYEGFPKGTVERNPRETLPLPPPNPDLAPSDCRVFEPHTKHLSGQRITSDGQVHRELCSWLMGLDTGLVILSNTGRSVSVSMVIVWRNSSCTHVSSSVFSLCSDQTFSREKVLPHFSENPRTFITAYRYNKGAI